MVRWFAVLVPLLLAVSGCSRDTFVAQPVVPTQPINQAPAPSLPPTQNPNYPAFRPQMPAQYPPQYYLFTPIFVYMQQPSQQYYFQPMWNDWLYYANYVGCQPYDFNVFWYDYCPQAFYNTSYWSMYQGMDQSFYAWMYPGAQLPQSCDPSYFWGSYSGYPMGW